MCELKVGDKVSEKKQFTIEDVEMFASLTGDYNPIHFDPEYASHTIFKKPIVHGPLVLTIITTLFAKKLPGPGSVYLSHDIKYINPVYISDEITVTLEVIEITERNHVIIETTCKNQDGIPILSGIARLKKY